MHEEISKKTNLNCFKGTLQEGIKDADVFIGLSAPNLLNEEMIKDGNYKMNPPLRSEENRLETIKALLDGTAIMVASDHAPHAKHEKDKEYNS